MKKVAVRVLLNTLVGVVLIGVWAHFVNLGEIAVKLQSLNPLYLILFFLLIFLSTLLRSLRLKLLLSKYSLKLLDLTMLNFLSQLLSFLIPIRAGEVAKSVYLSSQFSLPLGKTVVWVFIDRFLDFWMVLLLIGVLLLFVPVGLPTKVIPAVLLLLFLFTAVAVVMATNQNRAKRIIELVSAVFVFEKVKQYFVSFFETIIEGFAILQCSFGKIVVLVLISLLSFISDGLIWYVLFLSLGQQFGIMKSILGNSLLALTFLIPAAPGYVGSAEASGLAVFTGILKVESNMASAATVLFHVLILTSLLVFGLVSLYILKFDLNVVWKKVTGK